MRKRLTVLGATALAAAFGLLPLAATAHPEHHVVISERMAVTGTNTQAGTWSSAGAINDGGTAAATFTITPHHGDIGRLEGTHVLTSSAGTITIEVRGIVHPFPPPSPPRAWARGHWRITAGTGAYAGLRGRGRLTATADYTTTPPQITIVREGHVNRGSPPRRSSR